jgi:acyl-CoA synthetase (AMP-forming)/AMP-acid ligase II
MVVLNRFDAEKTLAAIERYRVAGVLMVPTHFVRLLKLPQEVRARYDVSSLKQLFHVGAPCPVDVKYQIIEWFGPIVYESYGATEQGTISSITSEEWLAHPGSVGKVREGLELFVISENGEELGTNQVGQLYVRDTSGFDVRFHNDDEKTESVHLRPGVFTIGEMGYLGDDGYLYLTDRFSDQVVTGGANIFPAEAEQVMIGLPGVLDVACVGFPDPDLGEVLKALVIPADMAAPPSPEELLAETRKHLSLFKCPRSVELVTTVLRTPLGKINKRDLRDRFLRGEIPRVELEPS